MHSSDPYVVLTSRQHYCSLQPTNRSLSLLACSMKGAGSGLSYHSVLHCAGSSRSVSSVAPVVDWSRSYLLRPAARESTLVCTGVNGWVPSIQWIRQDVAVLHALHCMLRALMCDDTTPAKRLNSNLVACLPSTYTYVLTLFLKVY